MMALILEPAPADLTESLKRRQHGRRWHFDVALGLAQGVYYAMTGLWSILDIHSFQTVTGPKIDIWLLKTVGVLVLSIGLTLGLTGLRRRRVPVEIRVLALSSAIGLAVVDVWYVARGVIASVYLLDGLVETTCAWLWVWLWRHHEVR